VAKRPNQRGTEPADRRDVERICASLASNAVGAEKSRHAYLILTRTSEGSTRTTATRAGGITLTGT
jgi:hypothetical protein